MVFSRGMSGAAAGILTVLMAGAAMAEEAEKPKLKTVQARDVRLQVPENWKQVEVTSQTRAAEFHIAAPEENAEGAELVLFHFGGPTGGIHANVERWIGQFHEEGRSVRLISGQSAQGRYLWADIAGTWKKPDGPPFARKTIDKPGSRVINVILITEKDEKKDYYFFKLSGPDALVASLAAALRRSYGGDAESEKPFDLKDAED